MFKAKVLSGSMIQYTHKQTGEVRNMYEMWYQFEGEPYSFKSVFFNADQISKAQAAVSAGSCTFELRPDRNVAPTFVLK